MILQQKLHTAVSGTDHIVTTDKGKVIHRQFMKCPGTFHNEKRIEIARQIGPHRVPKNILFPRPGRKVYPIERDTPRDTIRKFEGYIKYNFKS